MELHKRAGSEDKTVLLLEGMKHMLLHDDEILTFVRPAPHTAIAS